MCQMNINFEKKNNNWILIQNSHHSLTIQLKKVKQQNIQKKREKNVQDFGEGKNFLNRKKNNCK